MATTRAETAATEGVAEGSEGERVLPFRPRNLANRRYLKRDWLPFGHLSLYSLIGKRKIDGWPKATLKEERQMDQIYLNPLPFLFECYGCKQPIVYFVFDAEREGFEPPDP